MKMLLLAASVLALSVGSAQAQDLGNVDQMFLNVQTVHNTLKNSFSNEKIRQSASNMANAVAAEGAYLGNIIQSTDLPGDFNGQTAFNKAVTDGSWANLGQTATNTVNIALASDALSVSQTSGAFQDAKNLVTFGKSFNPNGVAGPDFDQSARNVANIISLDSAVGDLTQTLDPTWQAASNRMVYTGGELGRYDGAITKVGQEAQNTSNVAVMGSFEFTQLMQTSGAAQTATNLIQTNGVLKNINQVGANLTNVLTKTPAPSAP